MAFAYCLWHARVGLPDSFKGHGAGSNLPLRVSRVHSAFAKHEIGAGHATHRNLDGNFCPCSLYRRCQCRLGE